MLLMASQVHAECYDWPLRYGHSGTVAYDGDTIYIMMPGLSPELEEMAVRVNGVDTAEIRGKCDIEKELAGEARDYVVDALVKADKVRFCSPKWGKNAGRVVADVVIDGKLLSEMLIGSLHSHMVAIIS